MTRDRFSTPLLALTVLAAAASNASAQMLSGDHIATNGDDLIIHPVEHATFVMAWGPHPIYVDPVGGAEAFEGLPAPHVILVTDIHGDHLNVETLQALATGPARIIAPPAVAEQLPEALGDRTTVIANGESTDFMGMSFEAIPMYNTTEERLQYHTKGRGNGYVVSLGGDRIYISGDTEDIPEMRTLTDIDVAFVCFNLPYTMTEEQAASAVRAFRPDIVYPYHYRGSDPEKFASLVGDASEVRIGGWYE
ncbi:MAG: MBL fold metallo-hydrolase [Gemmatimonadota bacterium]|jgi:L-ascorbate metabolism protein UlaG (beta-lactamase superfamily)